jgi:hypothetical protein
MLRPDPQDYIGQPAPPRRPSDHRTGPSTARAVTLRARLEWRWRPSPIPPVVLSLLLSDAPASAIASAIERADAEIKRATDGPRTNNKPVIEPVPQLATATSIVLGQVEAVLTKLNEADR